MTGDTTKRPRGRPRLAEPRRHVLHVRCTEAEHDEIHQAAAAIGVDVADFMRDQVTNRRPPRSIQQPRVDRVKLAQVLAELQELGPLANAQARAVNTGETLPTTAELVETTARIKRMRDLLADALGSHANT